VQLLLQAEVDDAKIAAECDQINVLAQTTAAENIFVIPDSEEDELPKVKASAKRPRSSKTSIARKTVIVPQQGSGDIRTTLESLDPRAARRQARAAKLQSSDIETSTSSAAASISQAPSLRSTSTTSDLSTSGGVGQDEESDRMPDLVNSSYETEDTGHSDK
jgi:hypothetical protein